MLATFVIYTQAHNTMLEIGLGKCVDVVVAAVSGRVSEWLPQYQYRDQTIHSYKAVKHGP